MIGSGDRGKIIDNLLHKILLRQHLMTQTFSREDFIELSHSQPVQDRSLKTYKLPEWLGEGYSQEIELFPGLALGIYDHNYYDDFVVRSPVRDHSIEFDILLSGVYYEENFSLTLIGGKDVFLVGRRTIANYQSQCWE